MKERKEEKSAFIYTSLPSRLFNFLSNSAAATLFLRRNLYVTPDIARFST
jgi:hypothetical protein